jgi:hypothetical protein
MIDIIINDALKVFFRHPQERKLKWLHSRCQHEDTGRETIIPIWRRCPRRWFRYETNWWRIFNAE